MNATVANPAPPSDSLSNQSRTTGLTEAEHAFVLDQPGQAGEDGYTQLVRGIMPAGPDAERPYRYDPALLTLVAGIESRNHDRGRAGSWLREELALPSGAAAAAYYTDDVPAHVHWGAPDQKRLFILLGSSYSTWKRGTWTNKTTSILRTAYAEPHLVAFAGFLTPELLGLDALYPALTTHEPARDLYRRLRAALDGWKQAGRIPADTRVGLIGYSGGASLVISLLAEDQRESERRGGSKPLAFGAGGIAFSPVLDLPTNFAVLDGANAILTRRGFPAGRALTRPIFPDFVRAYLQGYTASDPLPYLRLTAADAGPAAVERRLEIIGRFYREFQAVDLATTSEARYPDAPETGPAARMLRQQGKLDYLAYYKEVVFHNYRRRLGLKPDEEFARFTSIEPELLAIKRAPLYLVVAKDDPVLSCVDGALTSAPAPTGNPPRLAEILRNAARYPNIRIFTPARGAHMGYFLDDDYLQAVLKAFF